MQFSVTTKVIKSLRTGNEGHEQRYGSMRRPGQGRVFCQTVTAVQHGYYLTGPLR
jgi:hypothetical protein